MNDSKNQPTAPKHGMNSHQEAFFRAHGLGTLLLRPPERVVYPYAWLGHLPFAQTLIRIMQPRLVVELGTHTGNSFCSFCKAVVMEGLDTRCFAIDTWYGDEQAGYYGDSVYDELAPYVDAEYGSFAELLRMTFDDGLHRFKDGSIDLLHIDGLHTYDAVRKDYETWKNKLSRQSVVLFHDTGVFDREFGVHQLWAELRREYPSFEFLHSHGLGVLLTGSEVNPAVTSFIDLAAEDPEPIQALYEHASQLWLSGDALAYQRRFGTEHESDLSDVEHLDCELYLDHGHGFGDNAKLIAQISLDDKAGKLHFDLKHFTDGLVGLRFDPGNAPIAIRGLRVQGKRPDEQLIELKSTRDASVYRDHGTAVFPADPWVEFAFTEGALVSIDIELEIVAVGPALTELLIAGAKNLEALQNELEEKEAEAHRLWDDLTAKDAQTGELQSQIRERQGEIGELQSQIGELQVQIEAKDEAARKLWNDLTSKDSLITQLQTQLDAKDTAARKLWDDLTAKDSLIAGLQQELDGITSHPVYSALSKLGLTPVAKTESGKQ